MRIYISGAITNNPNYREDFRRAEEHLREKYPGVHIVNPAKLSEVFPGGAWREYMTICETMIAMCDAIYLLRGWYDSEGARREYGYALWMELDVYEEVRL